MAGQKETVLSVVGGPPEMCASTGICGAAGFSVQRVGGSKGRKRHQVVAVGNAPKGQVWSFLFINLFTEL